MRFFFALFLLTSGFAQEKEEIWLDFINQVLLKKNKQIEVMEKKALQETNEGHFQTMITDLLEKKKKRQIVKEIVYLQKSKKESFAYWRQKTTTLQELIEEFGGFDCIYVIPPDIGALKINLSSQKPIPSALWSQIIEQILAENGIGIRATSPVVKQLYRTRNDAIQIEMFCDDIDKLKQFESAKVAFLYSFKVAEQRKLRFLETTAATHNLHLHIFEKQVLLIGQANKIANFLQLIQFLLKDEQKRHFEPLLLTHMKAKQAKEFLEMALIDSSSKIPAMISAVGTGVKIFAIDEQDYLIVLVGNKEDVEHAKNLITRMENKLRGSSEKVLYWYTCKHCDPEDAANVLMKIYPKLVELQGPAQNEKESSNFIVESKSSSLLMVVEKSVLKKIENVLKKIDQPKKMVRIEVLLFEKKTKNSNSFGLKDLKVGSGASKKDRAGASFKEMSSKGIFDFFLAKNFKRFMPFDLSYQFLLTNQDIQINACPTVTTVNSTTATISLTEEISVNTGAILVDTKEGSFPEKSFTREKFGIVLKITPTINFSEDNNDPNQYITLDTDIEFDTINSNKNDRPDVSKRHIENQVRIANGQTLIIGGLRRKDKEGLSDKIPFLGEIPGLGKLFSQTNMNDNQTEMFIFITPHIIDDPGQYLEQMRKAELEKRPGDLPEFLSSIKHAKAKAKQKYFEKSMQLLFDTSESINE